MIREENFFGKAAPFATLSANHNLYPGFRFQAISAAVARDVLMPPVDNDLYMNLTGPYHYVLNKGAGTLTFKNNSGSQTIGQLTTGQIGLFFLTSKVNSGFWVLWIKTADATTGW